MLELFHHFTHWVVFLWIIIAFYIMKNLLKNDKAERTTSHLLWDYSRIGRDWNEKLLGSTGNGQWFGGKPHLDSPVPSPYEASYWHGHKQTEQFWSSSSHMDHSKIIMAHSFRNLMVGNVFEIRAVGAPLLWGHLPLLCVPQRHSVRSSPCPREGVLE